MVGAGEKHVLEARAPDDDHVELMPMFRAWMLLGHSVLWLRLEEGVGHTEAMVGAEL